MRPVTKTVTTDFMDQTEAHKSLEKVVSRLGLEPRALALKAPTSLNKINKMILRSRPMDNKD